MWGSRIDGCYNVLNRQADLLALIGGACVIKVVLEYCTHLT